MQLHQETRTTEQQTNNDNDEANTQNSNTEHESTETPQSKRRPPDLNTINLRTNVTYGSEMDIPKPSNIMRLLGMNINGLRREDDYQDVLEIGEALKMNAVDIFAFQETNIDWRSKAKSKTYERLQKVYHHVRLSTSSSTTKYNTLYQPGGTLTGVTDNYVGRVTEMGSDKEMGRWSYVRLLGRKGRNIVLVSVYNVCIHHGTKIGERTAHAQQVGILRKNGRDHSPRKAFLADFEQQVKEWIEKDYEIIINGDLNEVIGADEQSFARISAEHELTEIIQHFHGVENEPPTYARGRKRLDYIFCTPGILSSVSKCGILPYSEVIDSDHRSLFVDFDTTKLFGGDPAELSPNPVRILHSRDEKGCDQYVKAVYKYLTDHKVLQRLAVLSESTTPNMEECERIDRDITRAMAHGMNKIRKLYTSPFSPQVKQARLRRRFYKLHLTMLRNRLDLSAQLSSLAAALDEELPAPENVDQAQTLLRAAQKHVRTVNKNASNLRTTHLEEQIRQLKDDEEGKAAKIRERIIKAEAIKVMYKKLRSYLKPSEHNRLSHIQVPSDGLPPKQSKQWIDVHEPVEIEAKLLARNEDHFGQAEGAFTRGELGSIPFDGSGQLADDIIRGNPPARIDEVIQTFLEELKRPAYVDTIPNQLTIDEVLGKFHNWKESTSTSPFTKRHLGHYHCLLKLMGQEKPDKEPDESITKAKAIFKAHYSILEHAVKHGRSIKRWQKVANSMIEKEPGNPKIHRLRVIHLYEADYNLLLSIFWARKLVHSAEDSGAFNKNCFGGRPGMSAVEPVFIEELQVSLSYLSRTNQVVFHNDATSCYDRIIIALANMIARRFGMSQEVCSIHGETLAKMKYFVSTALGISEDSYCNTIMTPVHGTGQGSCASPSAWLQICSVLFDCHERLSTGAQYFSPDRMTVVENSMTGYVDDTKCVTNDMNQTHPLPVNELVSTMQEDSQVWGDLLHTSGGALEIPKCNFYIMHWEFDKAGLPRLNSRIDTTIQLENGDRTNSVFLQNDSVTKAHKTLGCWKSANRDQKRQVSVLQAKSDNYARIIMSSAVTRRDNWTAYYAIYQTGMTFVLPTSYLPKKNLDRIEMKAVTATLTKGGYVSKFPRKVAFGPQQFGGLAMRMLWCEQLILQVQLLVKHLRCPSDCQKMLQINLAWAQLGTGMGFPILGNPDMELPHLECAWFASLRDGLTMVDGSIKMTTTHVVPARRVADTHLMDGVCGSKLFSKSEIKKINSCRLYLQVTLMSDISTTCGQKILPSYYQGEKQQRPNRPFLIYPRQSKPNSATWTVWRKALNALFLQKDKKSLTTPLGAWYSHEGNSQRWSTYADLENLYQRNDWHESFTQHSLTQINRRDNQYAAEGVEIDTLPTNCHPVTATTRDNGIEVQRVEFFTMHTAEQESSQTLSAQIAQLPESLSQLLQDVTILIPEEDIATALSSSETLYLASDGGAVTNKGSYGWVLQAGPLPIAKGKGWAQGSDPRSFRAEGYGMSSGLLYLLQLHRFYGIHRNRTSRNTIICDNQGLLTRIENATTWKYTTPNVTLRAEWDVEAAIVDSYKQLGIPFTFLHVKSHQDDDGPVSGLTLEAQLNVQADTLATEALKEAPTISKVLLFPSAKCQLIINGKSITRKIPQAVRYQAGAGPMKTYLLERNNWCEETFTDINWEAHGKAHSHHRTHQNYLIKLCHRHLPTGRTLHRRDKKYPARCPGCHAAEETHEHYIGCDADSRIKWRLEFLAAVTQQMKATKTPEPLRDLLIDVLDRAMAGRPISVYGKYEHILRSQERIGWRAMLQGYWSQKWHEEYTNSYQVPLEEDTKARTLRTAAMAIWQKRMIQTTWTQMISLWQLRNAERHGRDTESKAKAQREVLINEIETLYTNRESYPPRVQKLLRTSFEVHCTERVSNLRDWIDAYRVTFEVTRDKT